MPEPTALTIAGSDSGGGAGIQADLKAFAATGVHGASAITCVTSQNTTGVERVDPLPMDGVREQIRVVLDDLDVRAVKTGMLHTPEAVRLVAAELDGTGLPVVVDPVMVATSGDALASGELPDALDELSEVTTLITPNIHELELLGGSSISDVETARQAGQDLRDQGWNAVLVKGGHLETDEAVDLLITEDRSRSLVYPRQAGSLHGAGCTYASLIAGLLARGHGLDHAVLEARARMHRAIMRSYAPGAGPRVLDALEIVEPGSPEGAPLSTAVWRIAAELPLALVPEVGINIAYAAEGVEEPSEVHALTRRITRGRLAPTPPGPVAKGASSHVARVLLGARHQRAGISAAMNLAYSDRVLEAAEAAGVSVARFARDEEPGSVDSTMEWGTTSALKQADGEVDLIVDDGAKGKEAMVRAIAREPEDLVGIVTRLSEHLS